MKEQAWKNICLQKWENFVSGFLFLIPVITLLYQYTGLSIFEITLIANASSLCIALFDLPTSILADLFGRRNSMLVSVILAFFNSLVILVFPSFWGFVIASFMGGLSVSFWSGTGQAYLESNLRILNLQNKFGKYIGQNIFYNQLASTIAPIISTVLIYLLNESAFTVLAMLDVLVTGLAVYVVFQMVDLSPPSKIIKKKIGNIATESLLIARDAISNIFKNKNIALIVLFRTFSSDLSYLSLILLPTLVTAGMPKFAGGIVEIIASFTIMLGSKFAYIIGEKYSYNLSWVISILTKGILLIISGFLVNNWGFLLIVFSLINLAEGFCKPSWSHVFAEQSNPKAVSTTRSILFAIMAMYLTISRQLLSILPISIALFILGAVLLLVNSLLAPKILRLTLPPPHQTH